MNEENEGAQANMTAQPLWTTLSDSPAGQPCPALTKLHSSLRTDSHTELELKKIVTYNWFSAVLLAGGWLGPNLI